MPYRRLPNTDAARIKALKTAIEKAERTDYKELYITTKTLSEAKGVLNQFELLCSRYNRMYEIQVKANKTFQGNVKNARMYISHFVQVLYMSVVRAEIKKSHLDYYKLGDANLIVPDLTSNELILEWGENIIKGENERVSKGGVPIYNPSIAKVKVMYSVFKEGYQNQKLHQKSTLRVMDEVAAYRDKVDKIIFDIWEEVEKNSLEIANEKRLELNREYGIVYYYRKGEVTE
jgi:pyrroloquinoline quinone (PQQ) biosynthesis protein C